MSLSVTFADGSSDTFKLECQTCGEFITGRLYMDTHFNQWHCEHHILDGYSPKLEVASVALVEINTASEFNF